MLKRRHPIEHLRIATPCQANWETMAGDARVRHCALCNLNVYNFAAMTRGEISELLMRTEGRVCARLYRRADGTVLTKDCPSRLQAFRQRVSGLGTTLLAALVGVSAFSSGCATSGGHRSRVTLDVESVAAQQQTVFEGIVHYEGEVPLPGVSVRLRDDLTHCELHATTDVKGAFTITAIGQGTYRVEVTLSGFEPAIVENVRLKPNEVTHARVELRLDSTPMITVGAIAVDPLTKTGMSATFSQEFLEKIPIGN